jgi:ASC-1-like (ASCH) protein
MGDIKWQPRIWQMSATDKVLQDILEGREQKTGRAPDPDNIEKDYSQMKIGDLLRLSGYSGGKHISRVTGLYNYLPQDTLDPARSALRAMFREHDYRVMEPDAGSLAEAVESYLIYPGYEERISEHGVYTIELAPFREWNVYMPEDIFTTFYEGHRTVEGRALSSQPEKDYKLMGPGDMIVAYDNKEYDASEMWRWVQKVNIYSSVEEMLMAEGMKELVPGITDMKNAIALYNSFAPDYLDRINNHGIAAIHFGGFVTQEQVNQLQ